eukprot:scaffold61216_cov19-Tisochrysis_lutea.AAC.2
MVCSKASADFRFGCGEAVSPWRHFCISNMTAMLRVGLLGRDMQCWCQQCQLIQLLTKHCIP